MKLFSTEQIKFCIYCRRELVNTYKFKEQYHLSCRQEIKEFNLQKIKKNRKFGQNNAFKNALDKIITKVYFEMFEDKLLLP